MSNPEYTYIYTLHNYQKYYVGKSNNPKQRFYNHMDNASKGHRSYLYNWIRKLLENNLKPELKIIEKVLVSEWVEREIFWIKHYRSKYGKRNILNLSPGGEGPSGEFSGMAKLTKDQVIEIRYQHDYGLLTRSHLARRYRMSHSAINNIVKNITWYDENYQPIDQRERKIQMVCNDYQQGESIINLSKKYQVSTATIHNWLKR